MATRGLRILWPIEAFRGGLQSEVEGEGNDLEASVDCTFDERRLKYRYLTGPKRAQCSVKLKHYEPKQDGAKWDDRIIAQSLASEYLFKIMPGQLPGHPLPIIDSQRSFIIGH